MNTRLYYKTSATILDSTSQKRGWTCTCMSLTVKPIQSMLLCETLE